MASNGLIDLVCRAEARKYGVAHVVAGLGGAMAYSYASGGAFDLVIAGAIAVGSYLVTKGIRYEQPGQGYSMYSCGIAAALVAYYFSGDIRISAIAAAGAGISRYVAQQIVVSACQSYSFKAGGVGAGGSGGGSY